MSSIEQGNVDPSFSFDDIREPSVETTKLLLGTFALFEERATQHNQIALDIRYGEYGQSADKDSLQISLWHQVANNGKLSGGVYFSMLNEDMALYQAHDYGEDWPVYLKQLERVKGALEWWRADRTPEEEAWTAETLKLLERDDPNAIFTAIMTVPTDIRDETQERYKYTQKTTWRYDHEFDDTDETHIRFRRFEGNRSITNTVDGERSDLQRQINVRQSDRRMYLYNGYSNGKQELSIQSATRSVPNEHGGPRTIAGSLMTEAKASEFITVLQTIHSALPEITRP